MFLEILVAVSDERDVYRYIAKYRNELTKRPRRKLGRDLLAYALKRKGSRKELLVEYLEQYSYWPSRPLLLTRIADLLAESGDVQAASIIYKLAVEKMSKDAPLREVLEGMASGISKSEVPS